MGGLANGMSRQMGGPKKWTVERDGWSKIPNEPFSLVYKDRSLSFEKSISF